MKNSLWIFGTAVLLMGSQMALAQAPAGATGQCKDGSYTNAAKKGGACSGHKGVQTWFAAAPAPNAAPAAKNPMPSPPAAAPAPKSAAPAVGFTPPPSPPVTTSSRTTQPAATGGGPGMVWVNIPTKVYHCAGTEWYGKTKQGKYMSEADAIKMGARADHGKSCSK
jgi:hypothetical protein